VAPIVLIFLTVIDNRWQNYRDWTYFDCWVYFIDSYFHHYPAVCFERLHYWWLKVVILKWIIIPTTSSNNASVYVFIYCLSVDPFVCVQDNSIDTGRIETKFFEYVHISSITLKRDNDCIPPHQHHWPSDALGCLPSALLICGTVFHRMSPLIRLSLHLSLSS